MGDSVTFSAMVDEILSQSRHPNRRADVVAYANATLKELHTSFKGLPIFIHNDLIEDQITANASPFIWTKPTRVRVLRTVYYPAFDIYPDFQRPGKKLQERNLSYYYYAAADYYVFAGVASGDNIDIAYYQLPRNFVYYTEGTRPATWDDITETFTYLSAGTDEEKEAARDLVTNWTLTNWRHVVIEGTKAKFFKQFGDDRAGSSFALYSELRNSFVAGVEIETQGL